MRRQTKIKKEKQKKTFIVFTLVIFLVSSIGSVIIFYGGSDEDNSFTLDLENGRYKFNFKVDNFGNPYYLVSSKDTEFIAFFTPQQISLEIPQDIQNVLMNTPYFYLSIDLESENLGIMDYLRLDLMQNIPESKFFMEGITSETELYNLPVVNCNNATFVPVVILKNSNMTNISSSGNCLSIDFMAHQTMQVRDLLVYTTHGIKTGVSNV